MLLFTERTFAMPNTKIPEELKLFRESREKSLKTNWLVVVGLDWLQSGESSIGSAPSSKIVLPASAPGSLGKVYLQNGKVELQFENVKGVKINDQPATTGKRYPLLSDKGGKDLTTITVGTVKFYVIERPHGVGLRVKDSASETLKNFRGLSWWDFKEEFRITGKWQKFERPRKIVIPDILGDSNEEVLEGNVTFAFKGKTHELYPTRDGNELFFVFKDQTTGKDSYGTGRFLDSQVSADGTVLLDFNRTYNPPCAYISFATCPIAPKENKLAIALEAGEKKPAGH
jgi:uncharacterized protein (DUF1684 family)